MARAPAFAMWAGWQAAGAFGATLSAAWLPALVAWGSGNVAWSLQAANAMHRDVTWSLGWIVREISSSPPPEWLNTFKFALGSATTILTAPFVRSLDAVILTGALVYLVTLFGGTWATYAYFAALAPVVCWRLDDWLGHSRRPLLGVRPTGMGDPARTTHGRVAAPGYHPRR